MQPYFLTIGLTSLGAKLASGSAAVPSLRRWVWLLVAVACIAGLILGEVLARIVKPHIARRLLIAVAYVGSVATIARGITQLVG